MSSSSYAADFGPFEDRVWLNAAHQGPIPRAAAEAARGAVADKVAPHHLTDAAFIDVPARLRAALAALIGARPEDVILGNSASYGLDLLARGLRWRAGDEILFVDGEFPATVLPWRVLERHGVVIRFLSARAGAAPEPDELATALTVRTRVVCTSWVNSFTGYAIDVDALGQVCRSADVLFVLNASQGLGARVLDVRTTNVDAVTCCGYKWLLGPYGTGFCWLAPKVREALEPPHAYWLPNVWGQPGGIRRYEMRPGLGARALDVFCPASFLNVAPWTSAIEYLLLAGPAMVERYVQELVERLVSALDGDRYAVVSPAGGPRRSALVVVRSRNGTDAAVIHTALTAAGVDTALREGAIRLSPHLYNTFDEIDRAVNALHEASEAKPPA
jgi:selenocysteine lyase/cysteine desulfurase